VLPFVFKQSITLKAIIPVITIMMMLLAPPARSLAQGISLDRQKELTYIVQQDCGSCHGMTLKGGLGPSLLPDRVSVLPKQYLIDVITNGRQGTPMPPWGPLLTHQEINWIAEQLQLGQLAQKKH